MLTLLQQLQSESFRMRRIQVASSPTRWSFDRRADEQIDVGEAARFECPGSRACRLGNFRRGVEVG